MSRRNTVIVGFHGPGAGTSELTWGQLSALDDVRSRAPEDYRTNMAEAIPIPDGVPTADLLDACSALLSRHQALRTTFAFFEEGPRQHVRASGQLEVELFDADNDDVRDRAFEALHRLSGESFDLTQEWPIRVGIVIVGSHARYALLIISHLALDTWSTKMVAKDLLQLVAPAGDRSAAPLPAIRHPVDQVDFERSAEGGEINRRAMRHWRTHLTAAPQTALPVVPASGENRRWREALLESKAVRVAVARLAASHGTSQASVILAAFAALLVGGKDLDRFSCILLAGNRFRQEDKSYRGSIAQGTIASLELTDEPLSEFLRRTFVSTLSAYQHGRFDQAARNELLSEVADARGMDIDLGYYNFEQVEKLADPVTAALDTQAIDRLREDSRFAWTAESDRDPVRYYFRVSPTSCTMRLYLFFDTRFMPALAAERLLCDLESTLVQAVSEALTVSSVRAMSSAYPPSTASDHQLLRVDGSLIQMEAVTQLVRDAMRGHSSRASVSVFVDEVDGDRRITAYLAADQTLSPEKVHTACMLLVKERGVAMAPHWYVLCEAAPSSDDRPSWKAQPVRSQGSGRKGPSG
jgi:hypothetical protein